MDGKVEFIFLYIVLTTHFVDLIFLIEIVAHWQMLCVATTIYTVGKINK
jgi:hypothetical protein